jgi:hypothetical protein
MDARWFVFKPKIQIWVNLGGPCNGRWWYILWTLGPFYGLLLHFGTFCIVRVNLVYFSPFGTLYQEKSGNPGCSLKLSQGFFLRWSEMFLGRMCLKCVSEIFCSPIFFLFVLFEKCSDVVRATNVWKPKCVSISSYWPVKRILKLLSYLVFTTKLCILDLFLKLKKGG